MGQPASMPALNEELVEALAGIGVQNPKRAVLARMAIDPLWVRAWHLWAEHPHRRGLTNPIGNIILKLESGEPPPQEFLREAEAQTRRREWLREQEEHESKDPAEEEPPEPEPDQALVDARQLWATALGELQLQMTRATFDTWLRGSHVVEAGDGSLTVRVRHACAADWLQSRLLPVIQRTVARHTGGDVQITFVAGT